MAGELPHPEQPGRDDLTYEEHQEMLDGRTLEDETPLTKTELHELRLKLERSIEGSELYGAVLGFAAISNFKRKTALADQLRRDEGL